jgi:predicted membrane channel-forming protein YqfA (hemolysin III family)
MLNHLPVVGLGFVVILNIIAFVRKSNELKKLSLWFYFLIGIFAIPVYLTGEGTEEVLYTYPGFHEGMTETHETIALYFLIVMSIVAAISIVGLYFSNISEKHFQKFTIFVFILALLASVLALDTAYTGKKLRHPEIEQGKYKPADNPIKK